MADADKAPEILESPDVEEVDSNYKPPPEKTIEEILAADKEDESLRKYKEALLGEAKAGAVVVGMYQFIAYNLIIQYFLYFDCFVIYLYLSDPKDERKVIVKKLSLCVPDRPDMELDLTGDLTQLKKQVYANMLSLLLSLWYCILLFVIGPFIFSSWSNAFQIYFYRFLPSKKEYRTRYALISSSSGKLFMVWSMCKKLTDWVSQVIFIFKLW